MKNKLIQKYQNGEVLDTSYDKFIHTDPNTGEYNTHYDLPTDTYGTYQLPNLNVDYTYKTLDEKQRALNKSAARRGVVYVNQGRKKAFPYVATVLGASFLPYAMAPAATIGTTAGKVLANPVIDGLLTTQGIYDTFSDQGVQKTYKHLKEGDYGRAILSGTVDAAELYGGYGLYKNLKTLPKLLSAPNRLNRANTTLKDLRNITDSKFNPRLNKLYDKQNKLYRQSADLEKRLSDLNYKYRDQTDYQPKVITRNVDLSKLSQDNKKKLIEKRAPDYLSNVDFKNSTISNEQNLSQNFSLPLFGTDKVISGSVYRPPLNSQILDLNTGNTVYNTSQVGAQIPNEYVQGLQHNIQFLRNRFPGFTPFGSSVGVADAGFPHVTHDIDGFITKDNFDKIKGFNKTAYRFDRQSNPITYKINIGDKYGEAGDIDFNIIDKDPKTGLATGDNALELYSQLFPDDYQRALQEAMTKDIDNPIIQINKTPDELLAGLNPTSKTIQDSFEIDFTLPNKGKHVDRPLLYLSYADADKVREGLHSFAKSYLGSNVQLAPIIDPKYFSDVNKNKELLQQWNIGVNVNSVANDPKKMQNAFDYWVLNNTTFGRGVNVSTLPKRNTTTLKQAMTTWNPESIGGNANGAGLNTVLFGNSGHGDYYGFLQPQLNIEGLTDPLDITKALQRQFGNTKFTDSERTIANSIQGGTREVDTPKAFLHSIPSAGTEADQKLKQLSAQLNIDAIPSGSTYGNSLYYSLARPFTESTDRVFLTKGRGIPANSNIRTNYLPNSSITSKYDDLIRRINIFQPSGQSPIKKPLNKRFDLLRKPVSEQITDVDNKIKKVSEEYGLSKKHLYSYQDKLNDIYYKVRDNNFSKENLNNSLIKHSVISILPFGLGNYIKTYNYNTKKDRQEMENSEIYNKYRFDLIPEKYSQQSLFDLYKEEGEESLQKVLPYYYRNKN